MKILIDIRPLMDEKYSGVSEYVIRLLSALFEIDETNQYILFCNALTYVEKRLPKFEQANVKIVVTHIPNKVFNYLYLWPFGRPYFDKLVNHVNRNSEKEKIDLFFMPHLHLAGFNPNIKSILTVHDLSFLVNKQWFSCRKNVWHWFINVKKLAKKFNYIVAVSENTKRDLVDICKIEEQKVKVIYSGIDESFKKLNDSDEQLKMIKLKYNLVHPFILFLATIEPRKNIEGLIKAFEILKQNTSYQDLKLVIVGGNGWKSAPIIEKINNSTNSVDIIRLDYIDATDRPFVYNLAKIFAYPSFYEGFGFPPLEAMACGVPVVSSTASSIPEIVGDAGILVDPYNVNSIALGLNSILENSELAHELSLKGLEQAKKFSWKKTAEDYLKLFEELVK